jgi:hypothetical protein
MLSAIVDRVDNQTARAVGSTEYEIDIYHQRDIAINIQVSQFSP